MAGPYYLLTIGDDNWAPQLKYYHPAAASGAGAPIVATVSEHQALLHNTWEVVRWDSYNALNQHTGGQSLLQAGTWTGEIMPVKWCWTLTLESEQVGGHPCIKYFRGMSENMFTDGAPSSAMLTNIAALSTAIAGQDFVDAQNEFITGAVFGTYSRRGKIRRRVQA